MKRVLVVAQSAVVRAGLESLIAGSPGFEVVDSWSDSTPADFRHRVGEAMADVALFELGAEVEAFDDLLALLEAEPSVAVVALGDAAEASRWPEALRAGVRAILARQATAEEILAAVYAAAAGLIALEPAMIESLLSSGAAEYQRALRPKDQTDALTPREIEVLGMMAEGAGNKQIAFRLGISEHTVKFHVASIFSKLSASSRTEAVTLGIRRGLVML
ncbi:MAG: response regulator transcription factor [Acidobacteria bacterium]|nr:response regulator transcription factor [Acidobacteriota bacterium]